jgi:diadenosine tetraphosphate (Ap4A) HIT family hydrolase
VVECEWCEAMQDVENEELLVYVDDVLAVFDASRFSTCGDGDVVLAPRAHITTLTDLPAGAMADVLAVLRRLTMDLDGSDEVGHIEPHVVADPGAGHIHFHVAPLPPSDEAVP